MNSQSWHERMHSDLIVAGMAERTQEAYLRAVRQLRDYYSGTDPDQLSEQQLKDYLLWLRPASSRRSQSCGTLIPKRIACSQRLASQLF